jgi:hypothetical protein
MILKSIPCLLALICFSAYSGDTAISKATESTATGTTYAKTDFTTVKEGKFVFSYKIDGPDLVAEVSYPGAGWVAVGFNPTSMMKGANFIIGALVDGKSVVSDEFGDTKYSHKPDTALGGKNSIIKSKCWVDKGVLTVSFTIPLNSGDDKDVVLEKGKKVKLIFAEGKKPDFRSIHSVIGKTTIMLE